MKHSQAFARSIVEGREQRSPYSSTIAQLPAATTSVPRPAASLRIRGSPIRREHHATHRFTRHLTISPGWRRRRLVQVDSLDLRAFAFVIPDVRNPAT